MISVSLQRQAQKAAYSSTPPSSKSGALFRAGTVYRIRPYKGSPGGYTSAVCRASVLRHGLFVTLPYEEAV
eukprot:6955372-Pyramimonas_sp.AAC.1